MAEPRTPSDSARDPPSPESIPRLLASLLVDQRRRWSGGERPRVEDYLEQNSILAANPEAILDLMYNEYVVREEFGETPTLGEYLLRFPELADPFRIQVELHVGFLHSPEHTQPQTLCVQGLNPPPGYEVLGVLGKGGMGIVCKARHQKLDRVVALKRILSGEFADESEKARFLTEAKTAARLQHPNIVQIYEVGETDGQPYLALEFVAGPSLREALAGNPWPPQEAARLVRTLALAIHHAHERGVIHRDLKPGNILLATDHTDNPGQEGKKQGGEQPGAPLSSLIRAHPCNPWFNSSPKITDFGLAKRLDVDQGQTQTGSLLGTPSYMAPEQARGEHKAIDRRTDIYALGVILYEMLTGRPPFLAASVLETLTQVRFQEPVRPCRLQPRLPRDIETICLKCLQKDPARRYATGEELAGDLQRFLDGRPILARPVGRLERLGRWCRRNPAVATLAGAIMLLLLFITAGSLTAAVLLNEARQIAENSKRDAIALLVEAVVTQARAAPRSDVPGRRFDALRGLARAAEHEPSLRLRNLAALCLTLPDLRIVDLEPMPVLPLPGHALFSDIARNRYAVTDGKGTITVCRITDGATLSLPGPGDPAWVIRFSPDGRYLAAKYHRRDDVARNRLWVWDLGDPENPGPPTTVFRLPRRMIGDAFTFTPNSQSLAVVSWDDALETRGTLARYDLTPPNRAFVLARNVFHERLAIDPTGRRLAALEQIQGKAPRVDVYDQGRATVLHQWQAPAYVRDLAWHPDGRHLALACDDNRAHVYESDGRKQCTCEGHESAVTGVAFSRGGDLLATTSWDGTVRLWDAGTGRRHVTASAPVGTAIQFSPDDRFLGFGAGDGKVWRWEVAAGRECRELHGHPQADEGPENAAFSPTAPLLASAGSDGVRLWDTNTGRLLARIPRQETKSVVWQGDGMAMITCSAAGLERWPVMLAVDGNPAVGRLGPPQQLAALGPGVQDRAGSSPTGKWVAATDAARGEIILLDQAGTLSRVAVGDRTGNRLVTVSDDGRWLVTSAWGVNGASVWDGQTAKLVGKLPCGNTPGLAQSPDGRWLATGTGQQYDVWDTGTWKLVRSIRHDETGELPRPVVFSSDGSMLAIAPTPRIVRLLETATGRELVTLQTVNTRRLNWLAFSPDGSLLAGATSQLVQLWDLRLLHRGLAELNLADDLPAWPGERAHPATVPGHFDVLLAAQ